MNILLMAILLMTVLLLAGLPFLVCLFYHAYIHRNDLNGVLLRGKR